MFYHYSNDNSDMISVIMFMLIALAVHTEASECGRNVCDGNIKIVILITMLEGDPTK